MVLEFEDLIELLPVIGFQNGQLHVFAQLVNQLRVLGSGDEIAFVHLLAVVELCAAATCAEQAIGMKAQILVEDEWWALLLGFIESGTSLNL